MEKRYILSQYDEMRKEINEFKDQYLETIFKYIRSYFKSPKDTWDKESFITGLEDIIYEFLTKIYAITAKAVEKIYNIIQTRKPQNIARSVRNIMIYLISTGVIFISLLMWLIWREWPYRLTKLDIFLSGLIAILHPLIIIILIFVFIYGRKDN